jgi:putative flippase GtrA
VLGAPARFGQVLKFGVVGLLATAVHSAIYMAAVLQGVAPLVANLAGFGVAFLVSFLGHWRWTFVQAAAPVRRALLKFLLTSLMGLASNSACTWLAAERLRLPPASALIGILFVTPLLVFRVATRWAVAPGPGDVRSAQR